VKSNLADEIFWLMLGCTLVAIIVLTVMKRERFDDLPHVNHPTPTATNFGLTFKPQRCTGIVFGNGNNFVEFGPRGEVDKEVVKKLPPKAQELVEAFAQLWGALCKMEEEEK